MKALLAVALALFFLGSPFWTSVLIALLPRKWLMLAFPICALQIVLAYTLWWFYWGGGIGGEARLPTTLQLGLALALLPFAVSAIRLTRQRASAS